MYKQGEGDSEDTVLIMHSLLVGSKVPVQHERFADELWTHKWTKNTTGQIITWGAGWF